MPFVLVNADGRYHSMYGATTMRERAVEFRTQGDAEAYVELYKVAGVITPVPERQNPAGVDIPDGGQAIFGYKRPSNV